MDVDVSWKIYEIDVAVKVLTALLIRQWNIELSMQRLALVEATRITLKNALNLIGVEAPEKM